MGVLLRIAQNIGEMEGVGFLRGERVNLDVVDCKTVREGVGEKNVEEMSEDAAIACSDIC